MRHVQLTLWAAVEEALDDARGKYAKRLRHYQPDQETALSEVAETKVSVSILRRMTQFVTITFYHKVTSRSFIYYYSLRRQQDDTYTIYDVERGRKL